MNSFERRNFDWKLSRITSSLVERFPEIVFLGELFDVDDMDGSAIDNPIQTSNSLTERSDF